MLQVCNYCIHLCLPTSSGCFMFWPYVAMMRCMLIHIINVGFGFWMKEWWYYCRITTEGRMCHRRWTVMVKVKQLMLGNHFRETWFILIQQLNIINNGLCMVTNNNIHIWLVLILTGWSHKNTWFPMGIHKSLPLVKSLLHWVDFLINFNGCLFAYNMAFNCWFNQTVLDLKPSGL